MHIRREVLFVLAMTLCQVPRAMCGETAVTPVSMETLVYPTHAGKLIDGEYVAYSYNWANGNSEHSFTATFAEPTVINRIDIYQNISSGRSTLKTFTVEGDTGTKTAWVVLASITDFPKPTEDNVASVIEFDNDGAFLHYRVRGLANSDHRGSSVGMRASEVVYWSPNQGTGEPTDPTDPTNPDPPKEIEFPEGFPEALAAALNELKKSIDNGFDAVEDYLKPIEAMNRESYEKFEWWLKYLGLSVSALSGIILMSFVWDFVRRGPL